MPIPQEAKVCPICDWRHTPRYTHRAVSMAVTESGAADPLVPPRHEWPFGGEGIADAFIDRHGRLCFEYA